jgi:hypothetical protein
LIGTGFLTVFIPNPSALIALDMTFGAWVHRSVLSVGLVTTAARDVTTAPWTRGLPPTRKPWPELRSVFIAAAFPERINCDVLLPIVSTSSLVFESQKREPEVERHRRTSPLE